MPVNDKGSRQLKVFIASTAYDLRSYRDAVKDAAVRCGFLPVCMEHFGAHHRSVIDVCIDEVKKCDVVVIISAYLYGMLYMQVDHPEYMGLSITEIEYREAIKNGLRVLVFLPSGSYKTTDLMVDKGPSAEKLEQFKAMLKQSHTPDYFDSVDDLAGKVRDALDKERRQIEDSSSSTLPVKIQLPAPSPVVTPDLADRVKQVFLMRLLPNTDYPMAKVAHEFDVAGIRAKDLGFVCFRELLDAFDESKGGFIRFSLDPQGRHGAMVRLVDTSIPGGNSSNGSGASDGSDACPKPYTAVAASLAVYRGHACPEALQAYLDKSFLEFCYVSPRCKESVSEICSPGENWEARLDQAWLSARKTGVFREYDGKVMFPIGLKFAGSQQRVVEVALVPSRQGKSYTAVYTWETKVEDSAPAEDAAPGKVRRSVTDDLYDSFDFGDSGLAGSIRRLASLAMDEPWSFTARGSFGRPYPILENYLGVTYSRLLKEDSAHKTNRIAVSNDNQYLVFNTGLVTAEYDNIYALFGAPLAGGKRPYMDYCVEGQGQYGKLLVRYFSEMPEAANYIETLDDVVLDTHKEIKIDSPHILRDNINRLPFGLLDEAAKDDITAQGILRDIKMSRNIDKRPLWNQLAQRLGQGTAGYMRMDEKLKEAVNKSRKRARWNYKTAVPMYYPKGDKVDLLLPLCLVDPHKVDAALIVEKVESGNYMGHTILPPRKAYMDARIVCRPDNDWLDPWSKDQVDADD